MQSASSIRYDAFISYSHAADGRLAPAVQQCLQRLAKRWYQMRALRVFRDEASLSATPGLWDTIQDGLERSKYFIFMASPEAASSPWVKREIEFWQDNRQFETFLIAVTGGEVHWDDEAGDFDWEHTTAVPRQLSKWFPAEPLWVELSWARNEAQLSPDHTRFRGAIAALAAPLHGIPKEDLDSEDVRQHRLARRLRRGAITSLALLTVSALVLGQMAYAQRGVARERQVEAEAQARTAVSRALAGEADVTLGDDPLQASRIALTGLAVEPTAAIRRSLMGILDRNRHVVAFPRPTFDFDTTSQTRPATASMTSEIALSSDGKLLAFGNETDAEVHLWDVGERRPAGLLPLPDDTKVPQEYLWVAAVEMSADGNTIVSYQEGMLYVWDVQNREISRSIPYLADRPSFFMSPDGETLVALGAALDQPGPRAANKQTLHVWNVATGALLATSPQSMLLVGSAVAFTADGRRLLVSDVANGGAGHLAQLDVQSGEWLAPLPLPPGEFATATRAPRLARVDGIDDRIELWDYEVQRVVASSTVPGGDPSVIALSADGSVVVVGTHEGEVYASNGTLSTWQLLTRHRAPVLNVAVSGDGQIAASTSEDYDVTISTPGTDHRLVRLAGLDPRGLDQLSAIEVSPDGTRVATYSGRGLALSDATSATDPPIVLSGPVLSGSEPPPISWSPDSRYLAAALDGVVAVWTAANGRKIASTPVPVPSTYTGATGPDAIRLLPEDGMLLVNQGENGVAVVDFRTGETVQTLPGAGHFVASADGRTVVVILEASLLDGTSLEVWRWRDDAFEKVDHVEDGVHGSVAVNADGTMLAFSAQRRIVLRAIDGARRIALRLPDDAAAGVLAFSRDGQTLTIGGQVLSMWDVSSGLPLGTWRYSPEAGTGASASEFKAVSSDGTVFVDGSNGSVHRWVTETDQWSAALCGMGLQDFNDEERDRYLAGVDVDRMCP